METAGDEFSRGATSAFAGAKGLGQGALDALPDLPDLSLPKIPDISLPSLPDLSSLPGMPSMPELSLLKVPGFDAIGSAGSSMFDGVAKAGRSGEGLCKHLRYSKDSGHTTMP
jgi:hypothetical protein